jgi:plasmid stabilization system protein ParE
VALRVRPTPLAARQIRNEAQWWRRNRPKAPGLFRTELRRAFTLIAEYPEAGAITHDLELPNIRRVVLVATQHYLYYHVNEQLQQIEVLAVWSTHRGEPPPVTGG